MDRYLRRRERFFLHLGYLLYDIGTTTGIVSFDLSLPAPLAEVIQPAPAVAETEYTCTEKIKNQRVHTCRWFRKWAPDGTVLNGL
jgi:hypothetical protein